uniref:Pod storage protein n=1 Tax=Phaseolus vulgaris TaxID=3885 RepID=P93712_PHAVU|nr:pod storage protein [Phaseolus vulgaris]BAC82457.1 pod storage protein [Phaseolus vulgaris]
MKCLVFFVAAVLVASQCHGASFRSFPLSMTTGYGHGASDTEVRCASWRLAVEAQNIFGFETIPQQCVDATANYIEGGQYRSDSKTVNQQIYFFARDRHVHENDVILFNIDGTALSNIPYYSQHGYGSEKFDSERYDEEFVNKGEAPALPETLKNYNKLVSLGYKIIFLSGRLKDKRAVTEANLKKAGYNTWEKLILKDPSNSAENVVEYKTAERAKLVQEGYRIVGNIGDQWNDLKGENRAIRSFKLPNPMYYTK